MIIINDDLIAELGEEQLLELSDLDGAYTLNQAVIDDAITDSISFISSFFPLPEDPTPLLFKIGVELAVLNLRKKNRLSSDEDREKQKSIESYLIKMAKGSMPTTIVEQESGSKRDTSFAFRTSKRTLGRGIR